MQAARPSVCSTFRCSGLLNELFNLSYQTWTKHLESCNIGAKAGEDSFEILYVLMKVVSATLFNLNKAEKW